MRRAKIIGCVSSGWEYHARDAKTDEFIGYVSAVHHFSDQQMAELREAMS